MVRRSGFTRQRTLFSIRYSLHRFGGFRALNKLLFKPLAHGEPLVSLLLQPTASARTIPWFICSDRAHYLRHNSSLRLYSQGFIIDTERNGTPIFPYQRYHSPSLIESSCYRISVTAALIADIGTRQPVSWLVGYSHTPHDTNHAHITKKLNRLVIDISIHTYFCLDVRRQAGQLSDDEHPTNSVRASILLDQ